MLTSIHGPSPTDVDDSPWRDPLKQTSKATDLDRKFSSAGLESGFWHRKVAENSDQRAHALSGFGMHPALLASNHSN